MYGQLGDGTLIGRDTPAVVQDLTDVASAIAGVNYSLALKNDGTVWAWGEHYVDPLVDDITRDSFSPVQIPKIINNIVAADSGNNIGLGNGDTITISFNVNIKQPPVNSKAAVDALISFGGKSFGTDYNGVWTDTNTLVLTVINATGANLAVGDTLTINAGVDLKTADGISYALTSSGTISGTFGKAGVVRFTDTTLEAAVGAALNIPVGNITETEMLGLTSLNASGEFVMYSDKIKNLTGLEYAANLQSLDLSGNNISDIGVLSRLTKLQTLNLRSNQVSDIRALTGLTNLQAIDLGNNQMSDIGSLSGLTNLQTLNLDNNHVTGIGLLSRLTNLQTLNLNSNQIVDIEEPCFKAKVTQDRNETVTLKC